jgi:hypothetical protein
VLLQLDFWSGKTEEPHLHSSFSFQYFLFLVFSFLFCNAPLPLRSTFSPAKPTDGTGSVFPLNIDPQSVSNFGYAISGFLRNFVVRLSC